MTTAVVSVAKTETQAPAQSSSKIPKGISLGLIVAIGTSAIIALHAISLIAQMIVTPIIFGIGIGVAVHIVLKGPKESIECAKPVIAQIPDAATTVFNKTPDLIVKFGEAIDHMYRVVLQYVGSRVKPPSDVPYTFSEVVGGIATEGTSLVREAHKKASPILMDGLNSVSAKIKEQI